MYTIIFNDNDYSEDEELNAYDDKYYEENGLGKFIDKVVKINYLNPQELINCVQIFHDDELVYDQDMDYWSYDIIIEYLKLHSKIIDLEIAKAAL